MTRVFILSEVFRNRPLRLETYQVKKDNQVVVGENWWDYAQKLEAGKFPKGVITLTTSQEGVVKALLFENEIFSDLLKSWLKKGGFQLFLLPSSTINGRLGHYKF